jgi:hypothetical protein
LGDDDVVLEGVHYQWGEDADEDDNENDWDYSTSDSTVIWFFMVT